MTTTVSLRLGLAGGALLFLLANAAEACAPMPANCRISSKFGYRIDPVSKEYTQMHRGTDFACPMFSTITASTAGRVVHAGWSNSGGNMVYVEGNGLRMRYLHNSEIKVNIGDQVQVGQVVASSGNTGHRTTGPHLHLSADRNGVPVDPESLICGGKPGDIAAAPPDEGEAPAGSGSGSPGSGGTSASTGSGSGTRTPPEPLPDPIESIESMPLMQALADLIGSRSLNPTYAKTLASMSTARLYDEVARLKAVTAKTDYEKHRLSMRIVTLRSMIATLENEAVIAADLQAQRSAAVSTAATKGSAK